jgi:hypothetical protein
MGHRMMPRRFSSTVLLGVLTLGSACSGEQPTEAHLPEHARETGGADQDASDIGPFEDSAGTTTNPLTMETGPTLESGTQSLDSASNKAERTEADRRDSSSDGAKPPTCVPGALSCPSQGNATCCTYCDCMMEFCGTWFANRDACMTHCMGLRQDQLCCQYSYCLASKTGPHCNHGAGECCACPQ